MTLTPDQAALVQADPALAEALADVSRLYQHAKLASMQGQGQGQTTTSNDKAPTFAEVGASRAPR